jgi:hypothetical protein
MVACWAVKAFNTEPEAAMDVPFRKKGICWHDAYKIGRIDKTLFGFHWIFDSPITRTRETGWA